MFFFQTHLRDLTPNKMSPEMDGSKEHRSLTSNRNNRTSKVGPSLCTPIIYEDASHIKKCWIFRCLFHFFCFRGTVVQVQSPPPNILANHIPSGPKVSSWPRNGSYRGTATKGSRYITGCKASGGAAKSLILAISDQMMIGDSGKILWDYQMEIHQKIKGVKLLETKIYPSYGREKSSMLVPWRVPAPSSLGALHGSIKTCQFTGFYICTPTGRCWHVCVYQKLGDNKKH